jgi:ferredoxin
MAASPVTLAQHHIPLTGWKVGETVPWSVGWTGEQSFSLKPSEDFPGKVDLVQEQRQGEGTPKLAQMHIMRQRMGVIDHVCHVCGRKTRSNDRFIFPVQTGAIMAVIGTTDRYVGNVPPVHFACAKRAQRLCPHLVRHTANPVPYPSEASLIKPRLDVPPGMEDLAATLPAGAKIVYGCIRLYGPRFSRLVEKLRNAHGPITQA